MNEQHAHPVALKAGDKVLVEAEIDVAQGLMYCRCITDPSRAIPASVLDELREKLAAEKLLSESRIKLCNELHDQRDVARRELGEALEWMREDLAVNDIAWEHGDKHFDAGRAILARHEQPNFTFQAYDDEGNLVSPESRQQPEAKLEETMKVGFDYKLAYHGACVDVARIRDEADDWKAKYRALSITLEQAEAKLATIKTAIEDGQSAGYILYLICGPEAAPAPPAPPAKVEPWPNHALNNYSHDWGDAVQRRIEALESQKARA